MKTGHKQSRIFQEQKAMIKQFAKDFECSITETGSTLIVGKGCIQLEIKPKIKEYTDLSTNLSMPYYNERACLMKFFNFYPSY